MSKCSHGYLKDDCPFCKAHALGWERNDTEWEALRDKVHDLVHYHRLDEEADPQYGCIVFDRMRHEVLHFWPIPNPKDWMNPTPKEMQRALEVAEMNLSMAQSTLSRIVKMFIWQAEKDALSEKK